MSDAAPKPWVKALRIKSTPWRVLVGLWGHGSYKADGPAFVWVNRKKLAAEIGLPLGTLKNGLDALAALSWIVRDGGGWRLAWMTPGNFTRPADGPARPTGEPARPQADPAHGEATPARPQADPRPADGPHNLYGTSNYPPTNVEEARDLHGLDAMTANEQLAVYATPADPSTPQARAQAQLDRERAENRERFMTGERPTGSKLPEVVFKAIESHDGGAWSASVASLTWADACADTMDGDNLDLAHVLRLLDAWTAEARPTRQPGQPRKPVIWYTYGDQGRRARAWVERAMEATRARLRVVGGPDAYELERAEMER